jgi:hypothetical protein
MKLTKKDKTTLLSLGCLECDFKQIEKVISKTKYKLERKKYHNTGHCLCILDNSIIFAV